MSTKKLNIENNNQKRSHATLAEFDQLIKWVKDENSLETVEFLKYLIAPINVILSGKGALKHPTNKVKSLIKKGQYYLSEFKQSLISTTDSIEKNAILFFPDEVTHLKQQIPVYEALKQQGHQAYFLTQKPILSARLEERGIKAVFLGSTAQLGTTAPQINRNLRQKLLQQNFTHLTKEKLAAINNLINRRVDLLSLKKRLQKLLNAKKPLALVVGNDITPIGRLSTMLFKQAQVPTYSIQHGNVVGNNILMSRYLVDHLFVFGVEAKAKLANIGCTSTIHLSGPPYLKEILTSLQDHEPVLEAAIGQSFEQYILVAFSGSGHHTSQKHLFSQIEAVKGLAIKHPNFAFIFKLHRKDKKAFYNTVATLPNVFVFEDQDFKESLSIFNWLNFSTILITGNSAVAIEAMLLEKLVFTLDFEAAYTDVSFIKDSASIHSSSQEEFHKLFERYIQSSDTFTSNFKQSKRFVDKYFMHIDKAAENCATFITKQL